MLKKLCLVAVLTVSIALMPDLAAASVESSLQAVQNKLVGTILPLAAILGFVYAGFSFITGNPNARNHLILAMLGAAVGFGASSLVSFIHGLIQ